MNSSYSFLFDFLITFLVDVQEPPKRSPSLLREKKICLVECPFKSSINNHKMSKNKLMLLVV